MKMQFLKKDTQVQRVFLSLKLKGYLSRIQIEKKKNVL